MSLHLYEIKQLYRDTLDEVDDVAEYQNVLDEIKDEFQDKGLAVLAYYQNAAAEVTAFDTAIKSMKQRRDTLNRRNEALKEYLLTNMLETGITSLESPYFSCKVRNNQPSVVIVDELAIPDEFKEEVISFKIDKRAIKDAGGCVGAEIIRKKSLQIK